MCKFVSKYFQRRAEEKKICEELFRTYSSRINYLLEAEQELFAETSEKIDAQADTRWTENTSALIAEMKNDILPRMRKAKNCRELKESFAVLEKAFCAHPMRVQEHDQLAKEIEACIKMKPQLGELRSQFNQFLQNNAFIMPEQSKVWADRFKDFCNRIEGFSSRQIKQNQCYITLRQDAGRILRELPEQINRHNADVYQKVIGKVEDRNLDKQQLSCIVKPAHNHLVLAGAGTGKTTTVVGKVKYLLRSGAYRPEDILVLSFTNASATEMDQRIQAETGVHIEASTFHKLGMNIISKVNGVKPRISKIDIRAFVKEQIECLVRSGAYLGRLSMYLLNSRVETKSEFSFHSQVEYDKYLKENPPVTLKKETVKSYGEMEIANFLTLNNICF